MATELETSRTPVPSNIDREEITNREEKKLKTPSAESEEGHATSRKLTYTSSSEVSESDSADSDEDDRATADDEVKVGPEIKSHKDEVNSELTCQGYPSDPDYEQVCHEAEDKAKLCEKRQLSVLKAVTLPSEESGQLSSRNLESGGELHAVRTPPDSVSQHLTTFSSFETPSASPGPAHPAQESDQRRHEEEEHQPAYPAEWPFLPDRASTFPEQESSGDREYKCDYCPKVFNWKSNLIRHQVAHDHTRRYLCDSCNKVFTDPSNLQRHVRSQHLGARLHACTECGKTFATSSGLKQHTHIHSSVKPFRCEVCFKAYTQFSNLCRHKRMHATCRMQIKCTRCNQLFSTVTSLGKHRKYCDGASPTKSDDYEHCERRGGQEVQSSVKSSHSPPSPYFYPRPEIPLYPPSLFSCSAAPWTQFSPASGPPPLLNPFPSLLFPKLSPSSPSGCYGTPEVPKSPSSRTHLPLTKDTAFGLKFAKSNSEGTDSDASEEGTSYLGADETSSYSDNLDSEEEEAKDPSLQPAESLATPQASGMFSAHRQSSPKLASVCPDPLSMGSMYSPGSLLRPLPLNCARDQEVDMPYDLSQNKNRMPAEDSPEFHSKGTEDIKGDEPLDLRVVSKKETRPALPDLLHKSHHLFRDPERATAEVKQPEPQESPTPSSPSPVQMAYPRPLHPMFLESMYRMQQEKLALSLLRGPDRMVPSNYPFLGPLLNTAPPPFDFVRLQMDRLGKPVHDLLSTQMNKAKERYSCKFCGKVFPRSANLTRHLRTHTGEQPYKCKYCERSFSISSNLQRHVRNIHNKEKPFKCPLCDRCFGQQTNLDRHLKKHEADGPTILDDSPKRPAADSDEKDDMYFEEIRTFIGKVTQNNQVKAGSFSDMVKSRYLMGTELHHPQSNHEDEKMESNQTVTENGEDSLRNGEQRFNGNCNPKTGQKTEDCMSGRASERDSTSPDSTRYQPIGTKRFCSSGSSDVRTDEKMMPARNQVDDGGDDDDFSEEDESKTLESDEDSDVTQDGEKDGNEMVNSIVSKEELILNGE